VLGRPFNHFLHGDSVEDTDNNYSISIFTGLTTWRLLFPDGDKQGRDGVVAME
jgi:hypothetical protein